MRISGGLKEDGIIVGNVYDKYNSKNPIVRRVLQGFNDSLDSLVEKSKPKTIHEVGCGEGYWVLKWNNNGFNARGSDFSVQVINLARSNAKNHNLSPDIFSIRSVYDLEQTNDKADLIVCCEVLEHLEDPKQALRSLRQATTAHIILSVPREPIWRILNIMRGKYLSRLGNTPGHIQHWTRNSFIHFAEQFFIVEEVHTPIPWTMLLCRVKNH